MGHPAEHVGGRRHHDTASRGSGSDDGDADHGNGREPEPDPNADPRDGGPAGRELRPEPEQPVVGRTCLEDPVAGSGDCAQDHEAAEEGDLGPELVGLRRHQQGAGHGDEDTEQRRGRDGSDGTVFGSVIMKNRKISTSGEVMITRQ